MGKKSTVETLPKEVKEWLDRALVESNFSGYKLLAGEMKARGYEISKSAIHRYGQDFEDRLKTLKMVTEQARAVVQAAPDEDGAVNDALVRLTQEKLFGVLMEIEVDPDNSYVLTGLDDDLAAGPSEVDPTGAPGRRA